MSPKAKPSVNPLRSPLRIIVILSLPALAAMLLASALKHAQSPLWSAPVVRVEVPQVVYAAPVGPEAAHQSECAALQAEQPSAEVAVIAAQKYDRLCTGDDREVSP